MTLDNVIYILGGAAVSVQYTAISFTIGCALGLLLACCLVDDNKWLQRFAKTYVSVFRGTPLLVQLSLFYFVFPQITGLDISGFTAGIIAFSFNCAAYVAEIIRGGIQSVDVGQFQAADTLGIDHYHKMKDIILPQALRSAFPALGNELIGLLKETAIISMIGVADIMRRANEVATASYDYLQPLLIAALSYYILVLIISTITQFIERRYFYDYAQQCS